jgi:hypothetical protein
MRRPLPYQVRGIKSHEVQKLHPVQLTEMDNQTRAVNRSSSRLELLGGSNLGIVVNHGVAWRGERGPPHDDFSRARDRWQFIVPPWTRAFAALREHTSDGAVDVLEKTTNKPAHTPSTRRSNHLGESKSREDCIGHIHGSGRVL